MNERRDKRASFVTPTGEQAVQVWLDRRTIEWLRSQSHSGETLGQSVTIALGKFRKQQVERRPGLDLRVQNLQGEVDMLRLYLSEAQRQLEQERQSFQTAIETLQAAVQQRDRPQN